MGHSDHLGVGSAHRSLALLTLLVLALGLPSCARSNDPGGAVVAIDVYSKGVESTGKFIATTSRDIGDNHSEVVGGVRVTGRSKATDGRTEQYLTFTDTVDGKEVIGYLVYDPGQVAAQHHLLALSDKIIVISSNWR